MNAGLFIKSTSLLEDTYFANTVIFITEYNEKGAMGFVVNRPFPRKINELVEFRESIPFPLLEGGPVDHDHLYFVHRRGDVIAGGEPVTGDIFVGGDFKTAMHCLNTGTMTDKDVKIFIGYCGWDYQELDAEIAEGSWTVLDSYVLF
jgi:putative transcriptional regulator